VCCAADDKFTDYVDLKDQEKEEGCLKGPHNLHWYFALRGADLFENKHKRLPGAGTLLCSSHLPFLLIVFLIRCHALGAGESVDLEADIKELTTLTESVYTELKIDSKLDENVIKEMCVALPRVACCSSSWLILL
jgi:hypothetical protein